MKESKPIDASNQNNSVGRLKVNLARIRASSELADTGTSSGKSLLDLCEAADLKCEEQATEELRAMDDDSAEWHLLFRLADWRRMRSTKIGHEHLADRLKQVHADAGRRSVVRAELSQIEEIESLAIRYRNFSGFLLDYVAPQLFIQAQAGESVRLQNFCLVGAPGIGKTALLTELSQVLGVGSRTFDASTLQAAHVLNGLTRNYATCDVGLLFKAMVFDTDEHPGGRLPANALMCIDEVEKVGKTDHHGSVLDLMLALLEQRTAARFADVAVPELPLDLSKLNWCCTANSLQELSAPLRSRLIAIDVPEPTPEQAIEIAAGIYAEHVERLRGCVSEFPELPFDQLERLARYSPRQQKQLVEVGLARAVWKGHDIVVIEDHAAQRNTRRMGFL